MSENKLAYETLLEKSPFMRNIIESKIQDEVEKKQAEIDELKAKLSATETDTINAMLAIIELYEMILMLNGGV